jgi:hypothetical protein
MPSMPNPAPSPVQPQPQMQPRTIYPPAMPQPTIAPPAPSPSNPQPEARRDGHGAGRDRPGFEVPK